MVNSTEPILWRKRHNLTAWIFQILSSIVYGGYSIYRLLLIVRYMDDTQYYYETISARPSYVTAVEAILVAALTFTFVIVEIVFYAQSRLDLTLMLVFTAIKVTVWGIATITYAAAGGMMSYDLPVFVAAPVISVVMATSISQLVITCLFIKQQKARGAYSGVPKHDV